MYFGANPSKNNSKEPRKKLLKETGIKNKYVHSKTRHFMRPLLQKRLWFATAQADKALTWLEDNKVKVQWGLHKALTSIQLQIWGRKNVCKQGKQAAWLIYASSVSGNGPKFQQLIVSCL